MDMEWLAPEEAGLQWELKARRVQVLCLNRTIIGAVRKISI